MRIFTCTPVAFGGGPDFFARDSGLLCRGLQTIGIDSRAVMPGERKPEDEADLIRTNYHNLESSDWWQSQQLDALVLYAWGRPKFRKVAKAIHDAGIFLILNLDSCGQVSPLTGLPKWLHAQWNFSGQGHDRSAFVKFGKLIAYRLTFGLLMTDPLRAVHLKCGDVIACVSPGSADYFRRLCRTYGGENLAERVKVIPHSVENGFRYSGTTKLRQVVCVGRWGDQAQKRRWLLMKVMNKLLIEDQSVRVVIVGEAVPELVAWRHSLEEQQSDRVILSGKVDRQGLVQPLDESQIFYSPSAHESFGIAAAEALCSGCSVVAGRSVTMAAFEWFVSEDSGQLAENDDCSGHTAALQRELKCWENDERNPVTISQVWCERLHAERIAARVVGLVTGDFEC